MKEMFLPILSSGLLSGFVVALINNFYTTRNQKRMFKHELIKIKQEHEHNYDLETYKFIFQKKLDNIEKLKGCSAEIIRYNLKVMNIYSKVFAELIEIDLNDSTELVRKYDIANQKIDELDGYSYKYIELNNYFAYFTNLKTKYYDEYKILSDGNYLMITRQKEIFSEIFNSQNNEKDKLLGIIHGYNNAIETYQENCFNFNEYVMNEHEAMLKEIA